MYRDKDIAHIKSYDEYENLYRESIDNPDSFWEKQANRLNWYEKWNTISKIDYTKAEIKWFLGGKLNASYNCIDRHIEKGDGNKTAIIWEGNQPNENRTFTYNDLLNHVSVFANALKDNGIKKGDKVCIYMQMIPELSFAMLACARIGAEHSIVFGAFSPESLSDRINDSSCKIVITQDTGVRGNKTNIPMKENVDKALLSCSTVKNVIVVKRTGTEIDMNPNRDLWWNDIIVEQSNKCEPEIMDAEDPLFVLYTSGSTGKPKGVLHTTGGYLVYASYTHEIVFDYQQNDVYWCTADIGWITGHSYIIYGPLSNCATTIMYEGVPNYPDYGRFWSIVEKYKVNIFYTAPTALRALMKEGNQYVEKYNRSSLKLLGTVGEPIKSPEWNWYYKIVGNRNCPIVDTWWQTETGGIMITPLPAVTKLKPGSATFPFFGINPIVLDKNGKHLDELPSEGLLTINQSWPGQMRTIYGDHKRFIDTYFSQFTGYYFTGDGVKRDADGYYWITGRVDDVLNVSGHRLGTAEIEGAIGEHKAVAEAAVVGFPHDIKGQGIYAYVTLMTGENFDKNLQIEINNKVREVIGPHASIDKIQFTPALPKTRSGKIMRRILRKISENNIENLGDISTLADPTIVQALIDDRI